MVKMCPSAGSVKPCGGLGSVWAALAASRSRIRARHRRTQAGSTHPKESLVKAGRCSSIAKSTWTREGSKRCGLPAEVRRRFIMRSTSGPLESAMIRCLARHWFNGLIEFLTPQNGAHHSGRLPGPRVPPRRPRSRRRCHDHGSRGANDRYPGAALMTLSIHNRLICAHECTPAQPREFTPIRRSGRRRIGSSAWPDTSGRIAAANEHADLCIISMYYLNVLNSAL